MTVSREVDINAFERLLEPFDFALAEPARYSVSNRRDLMLDRILDRLIKRRCQFPAVVRSQL